MRARRRSSESGGAGGAAAALLLEAPPPPPPPHSSSSSPSSSSSTSAAAAAALLRLRPLPPPSIEPSARHCCCGASACARSCSSSACASRRCAKARARSTMWSRVCTAASVRGRCAPSWAPCCALDACASVLSTCTHLPTPPSVTPPPLQCGPPVMHSTAPRVLFTALTQLRSAAMAGAAEAGMATDSVTFWPYMWRRSKTRPPRAPMMESSTMRQKRLAACSATPASYKDWRPLYTSPSCSEGRRAASVAMSVAPPAPPPPPALLLPLPLLPPPELAPPPVPAMPAAAVATSVWVLPLPRARGPLMPTEPRMPVLHSSTKKSPPEVHLASRAPQAAQHCSGPLAVRALAAMGERPVTCSAASSTARAAPGARSGVATRRATNRWA